MTQNVHIKCPRSVGRSKFEPTYILSYIRNFVTKTYDDQIVTKLEISMDISIEISLCGMVCWRARLTGKTHVFHAAGPGFNPRRGQILSSALADRAGPGE